MITFDAADLAHWAGGPNCQHQLPDLMRRLIRATVENNVPVDFPGGSSVNIGGWDGQITVDKGNAWVPPGDSGWELGCQKNAKKKADTDYQKRSNEPLGVDLADTTFVFVTPRRWPGKKKWSQERRAEQRWRDVRALDADDLVAWLEQAPAVADWFARLIRRLPASGVIGLDAWWEKWAGVADPPIAPELVTAGRDEDVATLADWGTGDPQSFYVKADTRDEAIAFVAAALPTLSSGGDHARARTIIVQTLEAWLALEHHTTPLILIRDFDEDIATQVAVRAGHRVLIPLDSHQAVRGNGRELAHLGRDETRKALMAGGLTDGKARSLMRTTGRQLHVIRRRLSTDAGTAPPDWASQSPSPILVTLLLVGQWDEDYDGNPPLALPDKSGAPADDAPSTGDRQIVEQIVGCSYEEVEQAVVELSLMDDAPIEKVGPKWHLVSHEEAWEMLAPYLTSTALKRFEGIAIETLCSLSPEFDMPPDERYAAAVYGRTLRHSETLRQGMIRALALMGARSDQTTNAASLQRTASRVATAVHDAGLDWRLWATLDRDLMALAEAAPSTFLTAVEHALDADPSPFTSLFTQNDGTIFSGAPHASLLWALEALAWSSEHFSRVASILARLADLSPDNVSNHPRESLQSLFERGLRFTEATDTQRLEVLQTLLRRQSVVGWHLLTAVTPWDGRAILDRDPPTWRPWGNDMSPQVSREEHITFAASLDRLLLEFAGVDARRWADIAHILDKLQRDTQIELTEQMSQRSDTLRQHPAAVDLWRELRDVLSRHHTYQRAAWAMSLDVLAILGAVYQKLEPKDPSVASAWLFTHWPMLPDAEPVDPANPQLDERGKAIQAARRDAVRAVYEAGEIDALERLCHAAELPHFVGSAFAEALELPIVLETITDYIAAESAPMAAFASNALEQLGRDHGWEVLNELLVRVRESDPTPAKIAAIYCAAPIGARVWRDVDNEPDAVQAAYWATIDPRRIEIDNTAEADEATARLLAVRRSWDVAWLAPEVPCSVDLLVQVLAQLPFDPVPPSTSGIMSGYVIAMWLERLDHDETVPDEIIAGLEVPFTDVLRHHRADLALDRVVLKDPHLFADLVSGCFRRSDGQPDEPIDERVRQSRARNAFRILERLPSVPGLQEDGSVDGSTLSQWVTEARQLCRERGRGDVGDSRIGHMLATSPTGTDGAWPCEAVRDVLDNVATPSIAQGFCIGKGNRRDVTWRGVFEGGDQERTLAAQYKHDASQIDGRWPFTARILRDLAARYEREGQHEDDDAHWRDRSE